jgi:hypothetical protein
MDHPLASDTIPLLRSIGMSTIPKSYKPAEWRNTTAVDSNTNRIGIGLNVSDGTVIRLTLSQTSARHLAESIQEFLTSHSQRSSGMPSVPGSIPLDVDDV